jgi:hypothetical protein
MNGSDKVLMLQISEEIRNEAVKHEEEARKTPFPSYANQKHGIIAETLYIVADTIKNRVQAREP